MTLYQITSTDPAKHCDFFPAHSIHPDKSKIHNFCDFKEVPVDTPVKRCSYCGIAYPADYTFVKSDQKDIADSCIKCWGKNHIVNRSNYYEAVRAEILMELNNKM